MGNADAATAFRGNYDGDGHAITDITIVNHKSAGGLFNFCGIGTIKNLTVGIAGWVNTPSGEDCLGGLAGMTDGSKIENVTITGAISACDDCGGFVSKEPWGTYGATVFENCTNELSITSTGGKVAGFMANAQVNVILIDCVNKAALNRNAENTSAFVAAGNIVLTNCVNEGVLSNGSQFGSPSSVGGVNMGLASQLATTSAGIDGLNFATVAGDPAVATLIKNEAVVLGGEYLVMSKIATLPITLDTVGQTIAFDVALNAAFAPDFTLTGVGLSAVTNDTLITYTAIKAAGEDWPDVPADVEGTDAKTAFPDLPAAFEGADAGLVAAWAKGKGNLAYADMATASIDAFLLDCAESEVETEAAKFKIISIENINGEWVVKVTGEKTEGQNYTVNAKVDIVDVTTTLDADTAKATDAKGFFKAELVPFIKEVE